VKGNAVLPAGRAITMAAAAVVVATVAANAQQQKPTAMEKMATVEYLVGSWSCAHSVGDFSGKYTTTYTKVLGDRWLRETYDFPPKQFGANERGVTAEALIGYDEGWGKWVRFFATSTGDYFPVRMKETGTGWAYRYISFFGNNPAAADEGDATFQKKSDTEYLIDGPTYPENGKQVTEHHHCRKV
jgi:hypothetical protein